MLQKILFSIIVLLFLAAAGLHYHLSSKYPTTTPFISDQYFVESLLYPHEKLDKHVLGFLPYWRLDDLGYIKPQLLSEINYFSLTAGSDGKIVKVVDGQTDPGWRSWQSENVKNFMTRAQILGTDFSITVAALENNLIINILDSEEAQQNLINDTINEVKTRNLQGVNIDFEYFGEPDPEYRSAFTGFSKKLKAAIDKEVPGTEISLSIMPLAARENDLFEFSELAPIYDRFIGMSYEYYGASSDISGPVAPMKGFKEGLYFFDVETTYEDYLKVLPKEKLVMGVPYYGWERSVEDGKTKNSLTFPADNEKNYAAVISYARAREAKEINRNQCKWDEIAQETWCWFRDKESNTDRQAWIADNRSVEVRFDYANKQNFGGIAIWTLGYDKQYPDLWDMLSNKFTSQ
jgi:spore germination protein YaaH